MARLPGGLAAWRGRRLLRGGSRGSDGSGVAVGTTRHAALHALVAEAAKFADAPPPGGVRLTGAATVRLLDGTLRVGLPVVWGLPADHLRIVLAHELALPATKHPELVRALLSARSDDAQPKLLDATDTLAAAVEQVRDAAAIAAGGGGLSGVEDAASALLRAATVEAAFTGFAAADGTHRLADGTALRVADLHAGWRLRLSRWGAPTVDGDTLLAALPRCHPGLAAELLATREVPRPGLAGDALTLDELTADEERDLAAEVLPDGTWTRFEELPVEVYGVEVERQAREYVEAVRAVLGRDPDDRDELAGTLLRRPVDVERARRRALFGDDSGETGDQAPAWMGVVLLSVVVEYTLIRKGWRREHPLVARRLVGPPTEPVLDLNELCRHPDELRRLLATDLAGGLATG